MVAMMTIKRWTTIGLACGVFATWFAFLGPRSLGGPADYVIVDGVSMEPTLSDGDLAVVRRERTYSTGDVVAFRVREGEAGAGAVVIHRIVGGSDAQGFRMRGDNRDDIDGWHPSSAEILGKLWFHAPGAGSVVARLRAPLPLAVLAGGLAFVFVLIPTKRGSGVERRPSLGASTVDVGSRGPLGDSWAFGPALHGGRRA
jgi:signal peptidase